MLTGTLLDLAPFGGLLAALGWLYWLAALAIAAIALWLPKAWWKKLLAARLRQSATAACLVAATSLGCSDSTDVDSTKLGYKLAPHETHLTFTLPETPGASGQPPRRPAVTFRIPREFVDLGSVLSKNGNVYQLTIQFDLPEPAPWAASGPPAPYQFGDRTTWPPQIRVTLGAGGGIGGRERFLRGIAATNPINKINDMTPDGTVHGLVRYSRFVCYSEQELKSPQTQAHLVEKTTDDPMPQANCRVDRRMAVLFSPPEITAEDKVVFIHCSYTHCHTSFDFAMGCGASLNLHPDHIRFWPSVVSPARNLVQGFIAPSVIDPTSAAARAASRR